MVDSDVTCKVLIACVRSNHNIERGEEWPIIIIGIRNYTSALYTQHDVAKQLAVQAATWHNN